jgi:DNA-binding transcriptional LysR family regulator
MGDGMQPIEGVAWADLAVLLAGMRHSSLSQAAQALRIGQSTASRRLARLEARLGARLFDRTPEGLKPTQFALELAPHAALIEGHMADVERLAAEQEAAPRGRLRVALPDGLASHWLLPQLQGFFDRYPQVEVDCIIGHAVVDLTRQAADIALRFIPPTAPDLVARAVQRIQITPVVHPDLLDVPKADTRWLMLADPGRVFPETHWIEAHAQPRQTLTVTLWHALVAGLQAGLGAGMLAPMVAEQSGLVPVNWPHPPGPTHTLYMVYHRAVRDVPRIAAFRSWILEAAAALG